MRVNSVEELEIFKKGHSFTLKTYRVTESFPESERFGLITQMRRSSASIPANLMEGGHRLSRKEFRQFVSISRGSVGELKYHLLLSKDLGYLPKNEYEVMKGELEDMSKMLTGLIKSLS
jgi:four helix bundle protein